MLPSDVHLWIGTPCYGAQVHAGYTVSLIKTLFHFQRLGIGDVVPRLLGGDSLITRARCTIVAEFMANPKATHLLFIDADIQWNPESIERLIQSEHEVCCGIYPKKKIPLEFPLNFVKGSDERIPQCPYGFLEISDAATGFLLIRRSAIEKMFSAYPELKCQLAQEPKEDEIPHSYALFDTMIDDDGRYLSEDFAFSRRWQAIGGRIWCDPQIDLIHYGPHPFTGSLRSFLIPRDSAGPQKAEDIPGWMEADELDWLRARAKEADSVAEIGCWRGRSTFALAENCTGTVYAIDTWQGSPGEELGSDPQQAYPEFMRNVGCFNNVSVVKRDSVAAAQHVPDVDFCFIDGAHNYHQASSDIRAWLPKTRRIIAGHDYHFPSVRRAVQDVLGEVREGPGWIWYKEIAA